MLNNNSGSDGDVRRHGRCLGSGSTNRSSSSYPYNYNANSWV